MFRRIALMLLAGVLLLSTVACGDSAVIAEEGISEIPFEDMADDMYFEERFEPVLRFAVASDVHVDDQDSQQEEERLAKLFETAYAYAESQNGYKNLDGVFIAGDFSNRGTPSSMEKFFSIVEENLRDGTEFRTILGNHEYYYNKSNTVKDFLRVSGYESADAHLVINGYHVLMVSPDKGGKGYGRAKQNWLGKELKAAAAEDPTGKKPIFVFQHHHVSDTVYGSGRWGVEDLREVLNRYPQVIDFSGHSHFPICDPTSIWQGEFTALGTGTLSYYEMGLAGVDPDYIFPTDREGGYAETSSGERDAAQFYLVEVDANHAVRILGYDLLSDTFMMEPYLLRSVGDPSQFRYTNERAETSQEPVFPESAVIEPINVNGFGMYLEFPQAVCDDNVQHYRCELYKNGELADMVYRLSCTFFRPVPESLTVIFDNVYANQPYTVKIFAVNSWGKESEPLCAEFVTK